MRMGTSTDVAGQERMPAIFVGHGSPLTAITEDEFSRGFSHMGQRLLAEFGVPKAILMVSAHWYTRGSFVQSAARPKQVYDMYGFPDELYQVRYEPSGSAELTEAVLAALGDKVKVNDGWGIDHGTWAPLVHMFPGATIPIVQLSVNGLEDATYAYDLGKRLAHLRDEGYMLMGSGNVVHNLREADWGNPGGTPQTERFERQITGAIEVRDDAKVVGFKGLPDTDYAVPTPEHFLPLPFVLGASQGEL